MPRTRSSVIEKQPRPVKLRSSTSRNSPLLSASGKLRNITNTMSMPSAEPGSGSSAKSSREPPRKKKKTNSNDEPELEAFEKLRVVLGRHYFDVCKRLTLDYVPRCVKNVTECAQHHANKRGPRAKRVGFMRRNHTLEQIPEHRPDQFVEYLYQALMRNEFIGSELFVAGIQLILTINQTSTELQADYDVSSVVSDTSDALEKCLERFPPCRWDLRAAYLDIVLGRLDASCFTKCDQKEGLFRNLIHLLEFYIETGDPEQTAKRKGATCSGGARDDAFFSNYSSWMTQNRQIYDFDKLQRTERFERLFVALGIMVKLLEMDFAMWIFRNPTKTRQNLCLPSRSPLVARLVWDGDCGSVNLFVRKLFQMFANMIALQYPSENVSIFSRLLNLVAIAVNLSEFQHNDGMLQYPCLRSNSEYFAKQLWRTVETSPYYGVSFCLDMIRNIRTPYLLLSLSEELIRKLKRHNYPTNIRGFFQHLLSRSWEDCTVEKRDTINTCVRQPTDPYPILNRTKSRPKWSEIDVQEYVDLLFVGFRAYCDMYQIPACFRAIMVQPAKVDSLDAAFPPIETPDASKQGISEHVAHSPSSIRIVAEEVTDERNVFQGVSVSGELMLEYREHIKYMMLIEQQLTKLISSTNMALFQKWITFLSDIDPSLNLGTSS